MNFLTVAIFFISSAFATEISPWIEYRPGTVNIILSVPHGGSKKPANITDRINGCLDGNGDCIYEKDASCAVEECEARVGKDSYTKTIANYVYDELCDLLGNGDKPYFIFNNLHRSKVDMNREILLGAMGDPQAILAHETYHNYIVQAKLESGPRGVVYDFHGQSHPPNYMELGYLVKGSRLHDENYDLSSSSIKALAEECDLTGEQVLVGSQSFGEFFQAEGKDAVPSMTNPKPTEGETFYSWGYITETHGSKDGGQYDAIQLEMPDEERKSAFTNTENRKAYAKAIANAMINFRQQWYLIDSC